MFDESKTTAWSPALSNEACQVRDRFRTIAENLGHNFDHWVAQLSCDAQQRELSDELTLVLQQEVAAAETTGSTTFRAALHNFRSRIAVINNTVLLLGLLRTEAERTMLSEIMHRNLEGLIQFSEYVCNAMPTGPEKDKMVQLLIKTSERLGNLLATPPASIPHDGSQRNKAT